MTELKGRSKLIASALAFLIVFLMTVTAFAGAVEINSTPETQSTPTASISQDSPGVPDAGGEEQDIDSGPVENSEGAETSDGIAYDLDYATKERLADKILGSEKGESGSEYAAEYEDFSHEGLNTFKNSIYESVNNYLRLYDVDTVDTGSSSGQSSNLYETVNDYLNSDHPVNEYVSYADQLSAEGFSEDREVKSERTETAKVFRNDDGTYTAVINEVPMHYEDANGNLQDINLNIVPALDGRYEYNSEKNVLKTYFSSEYSSDSGILVDIDGKSGFSWTPVAMTYTDSYDLTHTVGEVEASQGMSNGNVMRYEDTYPYTTEEYIVNSGFLKHNLILSELPESAAEGKYLSYVGKVELADGLKLFVNGEQVSSDMETTSAIEVRNSNNEVIYVLPPPFAFEYDNAFETADGSYSIIIDGDEIYLALNTPTAWLKDPARNYPVVVDPNLYATINKNKHGYVYHYYYKSSWWTRDRYYYSTSTYCYTGFYGYKSSYYEYKRTYRSWFKWDTTVIPDSYTVKQIDFHGKNWRNYYSAFTVNVRQSPKKPDSYSSSSSQASLKALWQSLAQGSVYNSSVSFPSGSGKNVDVNALGGSAVQDMQNNLTNNYFYLALHKVIESYLSTGYGYFYMNKASNAQLYVTYDPCPAPPIPDTGGPYMVPEGTTGVWLDASATFVCGSTVLYYWDYNEDGVWDLVSTLPKSYWNKNFPDDWSTNLTLQVKDLTYNYVKTANTTFTVYNVDPQIVTPASPINGYEGQTITFPKIEFTDPGNDTWTYYYDLDGDNKIDKKGSTVDSGGKHYVPSVSWYFCDDASTVNLTVEDEDGGFSDSVSQEVVDPIYDGDIRTYKRPADPSRDYYYRYMRQYSSTYPYLYVQYRSYQTSYDYEYRGLLKFETSGLPSGFTPTNVTLRTYVAYVSAGGKVGVNDISSDPYTTARATTWADADNVNILDNEKYIHIGSSDSYSYQYMYLDPQDFIDETKNHSKWYGIGLDRYDKSDTSMYMYFYGGSYNQLTVSNGTASYTLKCYTNSGSNRNGMFGYIYHRSWPARDEMWRTDTSSYMYVEDYYNSYYKSESKGKSFIKFGAPTAHSSKVIGADAKIRVGYIYRYYSAIDIKIGVNDLDYDPELASDSALWGDCDASNIYEDTEWAPDEAYKTYVIPIDDSDYISKITSHSSWYGIGLKKNSGTTNRYAYIYTMDHYTSGYEPKLLVDYRDPYKLQVNIANLDPVLDMSGFSMTPTSVKEGDDVSVTGIKYTDGGPCDTHEYRVVVPLGPTKLPMVVVPWTEAKDGKIDFNFTAPDDDPEDGDSDITKDTVVLNIELRDDDYVPDFHYAKIQLELNHYEYYRYSWYKDWGVYQNLKDWDEMTVTWDNYPRSNAKSTPEDTVKAHGDHSYTPGYGYHWDIWNVTSITKKWIAGTENNYGLRVQPVTAGKDPNRQASSDYYTSSYRPILRFVPVELLASEFALQPGSGAGIDACLRAGYYSGNNFGTYSYLTFSYDISSRYYPESAGLIKFDLSNVPPESDEGGIDREPFNLTISNVAPVLDESAYKLKNSAGEDVTSVKEGEPFMVTNIVFDDPAAGYETEVFEYRVDWGNGTPSAWAEAKSVTPGGYKVTPHEYEDSDAPSSTSYYFGYYYYDNKRYMQWIDSDELGDDAKVIKEIQWKPTSYSYYLQYEWTAHFGDLKIYLSHKSDKLSGRSFSDNYGFGRTLVYSGKLDWYHPANSKDWMGIPLKTKFVYDGVSNLVMDIVYTDYSVTSSYGYAACNFQYDYNSPYGEMIYANSATATSGYGPYDNQYVNKFIFDDSFTEPYGIIPPIQFQYPDDHPKTGTSSDDMTVIVELRDDDGGTSKGTLTITVDNVPPSLKPGNLQVNGVPLQPNILLVFDAYSAYNPTDWEEALKENGQRPVVKSRTGMTVTEMNKYELVIWMMGGEPVRYLSTTERTVISNYISGGGKLILSSTYWYNYYSWRNTFYGQFGINGRTYTYYMGSSGSVDINGTGGSIGGTDEYTISGGHSEIYGYYYYLTHARLNGGTPEFMNAAYTMGRNYVMVHKDNPSTGSIAMMMGFDIQQIDDPDDQKALMASILKYFGLETSLFAEINEGEEIGLENFDIIDPAEGVSTETFTYSVDWGDGVTDPVKKNVSDVIGPLAVGNYAVAPAGYENSASGVGLRVPLEVSFINGQRFQQFYPSDQLGSKAREIKGIKLRNWIGMTTAWTNTYSNFKIYISHTTKTSLSSTFANNYGTGRTMVFSRTSYTISQPGTWTWFSIPFDTKFSYDGSSNLVMEVQWSSGTTSGRYAGVVDYGYLSGMSYLWGYGSGATSGNIGSNAGIVTNFTFEPIVFVPDFPTHRYRDDPSGSDDVYTATIHVYDDDLGEGTLNFFVKVNNIDPVFDANFVPTALSAVESGSPNVLTPEIPFWDPATQYDLTDPNEVWTFWYDNNDDGDYNSPDYLDTVPQSKVTELNNESYGKVPAVKLSFNDDYRGAVSCYIYDDDMTDDPEYLKANMSAANHVRFPSVTITNAAPKITMLEAYIPMEVRLRMTGREYHDIKVIITQTNPKDPNDQIIDTCTMERMPGEPKNNPTSDGRLFSPLLVKVVPYMNLEVKLVYDAHPDSNDPVHPQGKLHGANLVNVFLDFPMEDDYDPRDDDQSVAGHHWNQKLHFNANDDPDVTLTWDVTSLLKGKKVYLIATSYDDASDDNSFHWKLVSGSFSFSYTDITYYNDGSDPVVSGPWKDILPSPFNGTAPITYMDAHEFVYTSAFTVQVYSKDDDGGMSATATYTMPAPP